MNSPKSVSFGCSRFYCPWCGEEIDDATAYDHAYEHMDVGPYAVDVVDTFWPAGTAAHCFAEGITA